MSSRGRWERFASYTTKDVIAASDVRTTDWVRVVPSGISSTEMVYSTLSRAFEDGQPPPPLTLISDRKCVGADEFYLDGRHTLCSEAVLRALETVGCRSWKADPVPHLTPHPIRGRTLFDLTLTGQVGPLLPSSFDGEPKKLAPFGVAVPSSPVTFDGSGWTGDAVCLSEWLVPQPRSPWRAIIARGDFIQALCDETGGCPNLTLQPVAVERLATPTKAPSVAPLWQRPPASWSRPEGWGGSVLDRIEQTAGHYQHSLPGSAEAAKVRQVFADLERAHPGKVDPLLATVLSKWNGASLFNGSLTFLSIGARTEVNRVPKPCPGVCGWDIVSANESLPDDYAWENWHGGILFAAAFDEMPHIWAFTPEGSVRLVLASDVVVGPDVPFEAWLEDQVADLEWGWDHPEAKGFLRSPWPKKPHG